MMFRSLLFAAAPLLAAAEIEEHSVLLQLKGRDETRELLQRSKADLSQQTLRTLEENLMSKGGKEVATAKCSYFVKSHVSMDGAANPTCNVLRTYEDAFETTLKEFGNVEKIGKKMIKDVMKTINKALPTLPTSLENLTIGLKAEQFEVKKIAGVLESSYTKLGGNQSSSARSLTLAMEGLTDDVLVDIRKVVGEVQDNVMAIMKLENITLPDNNTVINPVDVVKHITSGSKRDLKDAEKLIEKYITQQFYSLTKLIGGSMAGMWKDVLKTPAGADFLNDIDFSKSKDVKKVRKMFWNFAQGYLDDEPTVESGCKSAKFNSRKAKSFAVRKICKSKKSPKCLDELAYFYETLNATGAACDAVDAVPKKLRNKKFHYLEIAKSGWDADFAEHCNVTGSACKAELMDKHEWSNCEKPNDVRKACKLIAKWEKGADKRAKKEEKRLEKEAKKEKKRVEKEARKAKQAARKQCYKDCKKVDRSDRKACKNVCKAMPKK